MALFEITGQQLRRPAFLEGVQTGSRVATAAFLAEHKKAFAAVAPEVKPADLTSPLTAAPMPTEEIADLAPAVEVEVLPPAPPTPPPAPIVDMSRMEAAIDRLRMLSDRLAAEARADVLELGLMVARKVVEGELAVNADRLIGVVKSAVSRVGESRRIVVHLCPEDAELLNGIDAGKSTALDRIGRGSAKIEIVTDESLGRGDCVVEGEHLSVDATLDAKFAEIRRALMEAAWEDGR